MKTKRIFNMKLAQELQKRGNFIIKTMPNFKKPGFVVYIFEDTDKFKNDLTEIAAK